MPGTVPSTETTNMSGTCSALMKLTVSWGIWLSFVPKILEHVNVEEAETRISNSVIPKL